VGSNGLRGAAVSVKQAELLDALEAAKVLLELPDNDFSWSSWQSRQVALTELSELMGSVAEGGLPLRQLRAMFAPAGPMQEVSLSSGWSVEFLSLAERVRLELARSERGAEALH
jgi:hypothetical protein